VPHGDGIRWQSLGLYGGAVAGDAAQDVAIGAGARVAGEPGARGDAD